MSFICDGCGKELFDGTKFCPDCGRIFSYAPTSCSNCGAPLNKANFCPNCGVSVNSENQNTERSFPVRRQKSKVAISILLLVLVMIIASAAIILVSRLNTVKPSGENSPVGNVTTPDNEDDDITEQEPLVNTEPEEKPIELDEGSFWALTEGVYKNNNNENFLLITNDGHSSIVAWGIMNSGGMESGFVTDFKPLGDNKYSISVHFDEINNELEYSPEHDSEITVDISDFKDIGKLYVVGSWAEDPGYNYVGGPDLNNLYN